MKHIILILVLLVGCKTIEKPPVVVEENPFFIGNVQCFEHITESGCKGCCCNGPIDPVILDEIHRCGH
jgi:hypothetical protein